VAYVHLGKRRDARSGRPRKAFDTLDLKMAKALLDALASWDPVCASISGIDAVDGSSTGT